MSSALRLRVSPSELETDSIEVHGERHHYLARVRRAAVGDSVELFDGEGNGRLATVTEARADAFILTPVSPSRRLASLSELVCIVPLIKGERMDLAVAKLSELGVSEVVVARCARSVVSLSGERAQRRVERFARIAQEASRQSGRCEVPRIGPIRDLDEVVSSTGAGPKFVFVPGALCGLREALAAHDAPSSADPIVLLTGPEGGLTGDEVALANAAGFEAISLGPRTLRAETAAIVAATSVLAIAGDIGGGG